MRRKKIRLLPDWKDILHKAWSVRVLAALAVLDFVTAAMLLFADGAFAMLIADNTGAVVAALAAKSVLSMMGIWLRACAQHEAEEAVDEVHAHG